MLGFIAIMRNLFFEEDFDNFVNTSQRQDVEYVHPPKEHSWGQRVVRIYDPEGHIIEIGESMKTVCRRFLQKGMTIELIAEKIDVPTKFVNACLR